MWAAGLIDLGLTDAQFWELTPRQFKLLMERRLAMEDRQVFPTKVLATMFANAHRAKEREHSPYAMYDLFPPRGKPHENGNGAIRGPSEADIAAQIAMARAFTARMQAAKNHEEIEEMHWHGGR